MRRISLLAALLISFSISAPACKLASRERVESIKLMNEAIELSKKGNVSGAEKALQAAISRDKSHARAHFTLGQVFKKQQKWVDAEKAFAGAIENMGDEPNGKFHYEIGVTQAAQGNADGVSSAERETKFNAAIASFQEALKLNPRLYKAHYRTAVLYEKLDQPTKADVAYRKTIELKPTHSPAFVKLGNMYIDYGHANVAMRVLEIGTQINDKDARMWNGLGRALLSLNRPNEAVDAFLKAKAIDPDMIDVLFGLGMAYAEMRKRKESAENLEAFLAKASGDVPPDRIKVARDTIARMNDAI